MNHFYRSRILHLLAVASLFALSNAAHAKAYYFGDLSSASAGYTAPDSFASDPFAKLKVTNQGGGVFQFKLTVSDNLLGSFGANSFLKAVNLDFNPNPTGTPVFTFVGSNVGGVTSVKGQNVNSNKVDFQTVFGSGNKRLSQNDWVTWNVSGLDPQDILKANHLSLVIGGIDGGYYAKYGLTSYTPIVSAVPEPDTYAMLLAGLGLIAFTARRRQSM